MIFYNSPLPRTDTFVVNNNKMKEIRIGLYLAGVLLLAPGISHAQAIDNNSINNINNSKKKELMSTNHYSNKEIIRDLYEQCLNKRNMELLKNLISDDFVGVRGQKGAAGFAGPVAGLIAAFPDIQWTIEDLLGEDSLVAIRWQWQGTHQQLYTKYAATGKKVINEGMAVFEVKDGKITNARLQTDRLGFLQQLGVLPTDL